MQFCSKKAVGSCRVNRSEIHNFSLDRLDMVRPGRTANFMQHLQSVVKLLPIFALLPAGVLRYAEICWGPSSDFLGSLSQLLEAKPNAIQSHACQWGVCLDFGAVWFFWEGMKGTILLTECGKHTSKLPELPDGDFYVTKHQMCFLKDLEVCATIKMQTQ